MHKLSVRYYPNNIENVKQFVSLNSKDGYEMYELSFKDIERNVLRNIASYCPFIYQNGIRSKEHLITQTSLIVYDIDKGENIYRLYDQLLQNGINFILCSTSNRNPTKYRLILELDKAYTLNMSTYHILLEIILEAYFEGINIKFDRLPMAQMFISYGWDDNLGLYDGKRIKLTRDLETYRNDFTVQNKTLKVPEIAKTDDVLELFYNFIFDNYCNKGTGIRNKVLSRVVMDARDYGIPKDKLYQIIILINNTFNPPLTEEELKRTIFKMIERVIK